jgi:hypothetical protein
MVRLVGPLFGFATATPALNAAWPAGAKHCNGKTEGRCGNHGLAADRANNLHGRHGSGDARGSEVEQTENVHGTGRGRSRPSYLQTTRTGRISLRRIHAYYLDPVGANDYLLATLQRASPPGRTIVYQRLHCWCLRWKTTPA